jgi:hypothetical protein
MEHGGGEDDAMSGFKTFLTHMGGFQVNFRTSIGARGHTAHDIAPPARKIIVDSASLRERT